MSQDSNHVIFRNFIFVWIALATMAILLIPFVAMQLTTEVRWGAADFVVMGSLLFGMGSLFVLVARKAGRSRRLLIGMMFLAAFLYVWAELAVGVFTNLGS